MSRAKPILISGIQPTGKLHLGNYLGALKNFVELQNSGKYRCYFFIADLHSLTEDFSPREKSKQILDLATDYLAAGISPKKSVIFSQSSIPAHSELTIILNNFTSLGELRRMTQFKDKSEVQPQNINAGLFDYPVLMASDILLYDAKFVPVGDDQLQHLELTRTLARKFNNRFPARQSLGAGRGKTFVEPKPLLTKVPRLTSLDDPTKKMSKSRPAGCLFMDDSPAKIREKIMRATTDSGREIKYDEKNKAGISNLLLIYSELSGKSISVVEKMYAGKGYAEFKKNLTEAVIRALQPFQGRKKKIKPAEIKRALAKGEKIANTAASKKIREVKRRTGLII